MHNKAISKYLPSGFWWWTDEKEKNDVDKICSVYKHGYILGIDFEDPNLHVMHLSYLLAPEQNACYWWYDTCTL